MNGIVNLTKEMAKRAETSVPYTEEEFASKLKECFLREDLPVKYDLYEYEYNMEADLARARVRLYSVRDGSVEKEFIQRREYDFQDRKYVGDLLIRKISDEYYKLVRNITYAQDFSQATKPELLEMAQLITKFADYIIDHNFPKNIDLRPQFNFHLNKYFLVEGENSAEQNYRAWGLNSKGEFDEWVYCDECGKEGFKSEIEFDPDCEGCQYIMNR